MTIASMPLAGPHAERVDTCTRLSTVGVSRRHLLGGFAGAISVGFFTATNVAIAPAHESEHESTATRKEEPMESILAPDGTRIAWVRSGDGPPLVLVHGSLDDHHRWAPLIPTLAERFTVYAIDRRGRGGSGATDLATYAIEREFEDVSAVVDSIGEPVCLLGHSYGALCSLEAALHVANLHKVILYEPPIPIPPGSPGFPPGTLEAMETLVAAGDREGAVLVFAREIVQVPEEAITALRSTPEWPAITALADTLLYEVRAVDGYVFDPERFRTLMTPTLLLLGSESSQFLKSATAAVDAALPDGELVMLPGQGHLAMDTAPDLFLREIFSFLTDEPNAIVAESGSLYDSTSARVG